MYKVFFCNVHDSEWWIIESTYTKFQFYFLEIFKCNKLKNAQIELRGISIELHRLQTDAR